MVDTLTAAEVLQLRMRAQLLTHVDPDQGLEARHSPDAEAVAAVTRHMLALQGQDWLASRWALGVRAPGTHVDDVSAALDAGLIVRSWPMRGTVHLVAAEDIGWVQRLTEARLLRGVPKRREFLGLAASALDRLVEVSLAALAGGARLTRDELSNAWTAAGIEWQSNWRYFVIWWLCQNGLATIGPLTKTTGEVAAEPLLVFADDWITHPRLIAGDDALAELFTRYVHGRGPATLQDFAWWTGLTMRDTRRACELTQEQGTVTQVETADSGASWVTSAALATSFETGASALAARTSWHLLTAFDEHLLGYTDRRPQLGLDQLAQIVPGRNGVFRATVVADGNTRGTWRRATTHGSHVVATPLASEHIDATALAPALERWARFHGFDAGTLELAP